MYVYKVTIRLAPVLPTSVAVVHFPNPKAATEASIEVLNQGVGIRESFTPSPFLTIHHHPNRMRRAPGR